MRTFILVLSSAYFSTPAFSQLDSVFFFNEFSLSANHTNLANDNTENRTGFGIGAYYSLMPERRFNVFFGFEFNRTSQFKTSIYEGKVSQSTNVTYHINTVSVPVACRVNFGSKTRVFIETGPFLDLNVRLRAEGTRQSYNGGRTEYNETFGATGLVLGTSVGIGMKFPIKNNELIVKTDYKYGFNPVSAYSEEVRNDYFRLMLGLRI
jgi:hypothetical protein